MAATKENRKVFEYFGPDHHDPAQRDCLRATWPVGPVWMNPPYSEAERACNKKCVKKRCVERGFCLDVDKPGCYDFVRAAALARKHGTTTVCLLASRTDTAWWHEFVYNEKTGRYRPGVKVRFLRGRLTFEGQQNGAPFPSVIVVFKAKQHER
jgi:site-specific DNA-methyltransferase (adenine-specific)